VRAIRESLFTCYNSQRPTPFTCEPKTHTKHSATHSRSPHVPEHKVDQLGKTVWEELETIVEERLMANKPEEQTQSTTSGKESGNGAGSGNGDEPMVVPDDVYA
jgi:hypothetical protein